MSTALTLVNQQNGNLAFKLFTFSGNEHFDHVRRFNYYSLIWVKTGKGSVMADFSETPFSENALFAFSPYQPFMFAETEELTGVVLHFHPDFFCIHKHQREVACNGVLFNNIYDPPFVQLSEGDASSLDGWIDEIRTELQRSALAQYELLVSYLKIILIHASRIKAAQNPEISVDGDTSQEPFVLQHLKEHIETHFKVKHTPSDYAEMLHITAKALGKLTKAYFNKTMSQLISERIIIEAKRELYLTNKAVKEIAYELGYDDAHYFSRFFKQNADVSPLEFRETVGFAKAEMS